jgi:SAM-dependent methyltransferase
MPADAPELQLWSHVQNQRANLFQGSQSRLRALVRRAERFRGAGTLLNIGCGDGFLERAAQQRGWKVISLDPDAAAIARLTSQGIDARCGSIEAMPLPSASLDVVICTEVLEHLSSEAASAGLGEIARVLKPGGILLGTVPWREDLAASEVFCPHCGQTFHRWGHRQSFDEAGLRDLLSRHFSVLRLRAVYYPTWNVADWKGKLAIAARLLFARAGIHSDLSSIFFIARKPPR